MCLHSKDFDVNNIPVAASATATTATATATNAAPPTAAAAAPDDGATPVISHDICPHVDF